MFGGKTFLQEEGGPIGNRLAMACSRVVMTDWGEKYLDILDRAGIITTLLKIYVDAVRQISTKIRDGLRYEADKEDWTWSVEAEEEDVRRRSENETVDARMARILQPAMNSINGDLVFTTELQEDFPNGRLPTIDFRMWFEEDQEVKHTFFNKSMKTQLQLPKRSAMSEKQKISILSNDLNRGLSNINVEKMPEIEKKEVTNHFVKQLKNSGYQRQECREIGVRVSGVKNWLRRRKRREEKGEDFYRSGTSTLQSRIKKKLLDPVRWYKPRPDDDEEGGNGKERNEEGIRKGGKKRKAMDG